MAEQLYATLKTNQGDIEIRLLPDYAPRTVRNFVELAQGAREWTHPATGESPPTSSTTARPSIE